MEAADASPSDGGPRDAAYWRERRQAGKKSPPHPCAPAQQTSLQCAALAGEDGKGAACSGAYAAYKACLAEWRKEERLKRGSLLG